MRATYNVYNSNHYTATNLPLPNKIKNLSDPHQSMYHHYVYAQLAQGQPLEEVQAQGLHHVLCHIDPFDTCPSCHLEDIPMGPTFDQIPCPHLLEFLARLCLTPDHIHPEYNTLGNQPATCTWCFYTQPVKGHTPLLTDMELSPEFNHHLTTHPLAISMERAAHLLP